MKRLFLTSCRAALALALTFSGASALAETKEGLAWMKTVTTTQPGDFPMLEPCSLVFNVSWNGVLKAGEADVEFKVADEGDLTGALEATGLARSTGLAHVLWPYRAKLRSFVDPKTLRPLSISQSEHDRKEENIYETKFIGDFVFNKRVTTPNGAAGQPVTSEKVYESGPAMHDLVSAILYVRSFPLETDGEIFSLVTFPFDDRYLVSLTQRGREPFHFRSADVESIKFEIEIQKIKKNDELKSYKNKVQTAHVWLSDDELRLPLELRAEIFVGSIRATLVEHETAGGAPAAAGVEASGESESIVDQAAKRAAGLLPRVGRKKG